MQFAKEGREECRWAKWWWNQLFWVIIILSALQKISQSKNILLPSSIPKRLPRLFVFTPFLAWITWVLIRICCNCTFAHLMCIYCKLLYCNIVFVWLYFYSKALMLGSNLRPERKMRCTLRRQPWFYGLFYGPDSFLAFLSDIAWYLFVCICGYHTIPGFASRDGYPNSAVLYIEILELQDVCASARVWHEWPVSGGSGSCKIPSGLASHTVFWDASDFCRSMHCLHRTGEGLVVSSSSLLSREPLCVCSPGGLCRVQVHIQFHICNFAVCSSTARGFGHHFWDAAIQICAEYCC